MSFGKRLKAVIKEERYTQKQFAEEVGFSLRAIEEYIGDRNPPSGELFMEVGNNITFKKYIIWLLTGNTDPNAGQICPDFSIQEKCGLITGENDTQKKA